MIGLAGLRRPSRHACAEQAKVSPGELARELETGIQAAPSPGRVQPDPARVVRDDGALHQSTEGETPRVLQKKLAFLGAKEFEAREVDGALICFGFTEIDVQRGSRAQPRGTLVKHFQAGLQALPRPAGTRRGGRLAGGAQGCLQAQPPSVLVLGNDSRHGQGVAQGVHLLVGLDAGQPHTLAAPRHPALGIDAPVAHLVPADSAPAPEHRQGDRDVGTPTIGLDARLAAPQRIPVETHLAAVEDQGVELGTVGIDGEEVAVAAVPIGVEHQRYLVFGEHALHVPAHLLRHDGRGLGVVGMHVDVQSLAVVSHAQFGSASGGTPRHGSHLDEAADRCRISQ